MKHSLYSKHNGERTNDKLLDVSINALMTGISLHFQLLHLQLQLSYSGTLLYTVTWQRPIAVIYTNTCTLHQLVTSVIPNKSFVIFVITVLQRHASLHSYLTATDSCHQCQHTHGVNYSKILFILQLIVNIYTDTHTHSDRLASELAPLKNFYLATKITIILTSEPFGYINNQSWFIKVAKTTTKSTGEG